MKVVLLSTTDNYGGAAIACKRLFVALRKSREIEVKLIVRSAETKEKGIYALDKTLWEKEKNFFYFVWERFVIWYHNCFSRKNLFAVSIANAGTDISALPEVQEADIIHLHWINQGFLSLKDIRKLLALGKPVVWTLHDMWPCTAICHYAWACDHYRESCGNCFYLRYPSSGDLSARIWKKKNFLNDSGMKLVTVSSWLQQKVKTSALTNRLESIVIPNVLDLGLFYPRDREEARKRLGINRGKKIIAFGAAKIDNPLKGFGLLKKALLDICRQKERENDFMLLLFGKLGGSPEEVFKDLPCAYKYMGEVHSGELLADLYSAADVTVVPSHYETFGQVIIESMACGTPVVAFNNSGQTDIISHREDGYLAVYDSAEDLGKGIRWALFETQGTEIAHKAIQKVKTCYAEEVVAQKYLDFYKKLFPETQKP